MIEAGGRTGERQKGDGKDKRRGESFTKNISGNIIWKECWRSAKVDGIRFSGA